MAFQVEHARWHPKEATALPCYGDLILKMESNGMQLAKYDIIYHQKRAKKIVCRPKKVRSWSITDIELYLSCDAPREPMPAMPTFKHPATALSHTTTSETSQFKGGTCWKFQSAKGCDGSCLWPTTHNCYSCGGPHSTRTCPSNTNSTG